MPDLWPNSSDSPINWPFPNDPALSLNKPIIAILSGAPYDHSVAGRNSFTSGTPERIIAVVDDDFRVRESIQSLAESAGYVVLLFSSAEECLSSGRLSEIACLIADVRMSEMNGIELQRQVRTQR